MKIEVVTARKKFKADFSYKGRSTRKKAYTKIDKAATDWLLKTIQGIPGEVVSVINLGSGLKTRCLNSTSYSGDYHYTMTLSFYLAVFFKRSKNE